MIVLDTHALIWWADSDSKPSKRALQAARAEARRGGQIASAISVFEIEGSDSLQGIRDPSGSVICACYLS